MRMEGEPPARPAPCPLGSGLREPMATPAQDRRPPPQRLSPARLRCASVGARQTAGDAKTPGEGRSSPSFVKTKPSFVLRQRLRPGWLSRKRKKLAKTVKNSCPTSRNRPEFRAARPSAARPSPVTRSDVGRSDACDGAVRVAMAGVGMVQMPFHKIVDMIAMRHRLVSAAGTMNMAGLMAGTTVSRGAGIRIGLRHLDHMVAMRMVQMPIMEVIDMVAVTHGGMAAASAMRVGVTVVAGLRTAVHHWFSFSCTHMWGGIQRLSASPCPSTSAAMLGNSRSGVASPFGSTVAPAPARPLRRLIQAVLSPIDFAGTTSW
jgi:hypothetical protein